MTDVAPVVTKETGDAANGATAKADTDDADDKLARSEVECFILEDFFVPKHEEHLLRPPVEDQDRKIDKKDKKKKRPVVKIDIRQVLNILSDKEWQH